MIAKAEKIDINRAAGFWLDTIEDQFDVALGPLDSELCAYLCKNILERWMESTTTQSAGIELFKRVYTAYKNDAQCFVAAVLEQARKLGGLV